MPQGRGIYPNFWSYFEGYKKGVTIHYIDSGIDTGNIIIRQEAVIGLCETLRSSNKILMNLAEQVFMDNIDNIIHGKLVVLEQSEEECDSFYHSRTLSERYVEILPNCWDTGIDYCTSMGRDFFISAQFIDKYIKELHD